MVSEKILGRPPRRRKRGLGSGPAFSQWLGASITLCLTIDSNPRLEGWVWGPINILLVYISESCPNSQCGFTILSIVWLMTFKRGHRRRTIIFQHWLAAIEWVNWGLMSTALKGYAFTISGHAAYINKMDGGHLMTPECSTVYASLAFSAMGTILCTISVAFVVCVVDVEYRRKIAWTRVGSNDEERQEDQRRYRPVGLSIMITILYSNVQVSNGYMNSREWASQNFT